MSERLPVGRSHQTLRQAVAEEIRQMIVTGQLAPGERLVEDKLAEQLGVSRNPVREAIRSLESTGLVEVLPRRGAHVCSVDLDDVRQLLELRGVLEGYAAALAAERRTDDDVAQLDKSIADGRRASRRRDHVTAASCHRAFHLAVEAAAGNRYLNDVVGPLRHRTEMVFSVLADRRSGFSWDEHEAIRDAIADGDQEAARKHVVEHLVSVVHDLEVAGGAGDGGA